MGFTQSQKDWFKQRDEFKCRFPVKFHRKGYTTCNRESTKFAPLHVHHVVPQRYSRVWLLWNDSQIDSELQGILLCPTHHVQVIHMDIPLAKANFFVDKKSFEKVFLLRNAKADLGEKYWNDAYDHILKKIIISRNERFLTSNRGYPYPPNKRWKK